MAFATAREFTALAVGAGREPGVYHDRFVTEPSIAAAPAPSGS